MTTRRHIVSNTIVLRRQIMPVVTLLRSILVDISDIKEAVKKDQ